jgi:phosphohistidine swiveling domain-containing protein
MAGVIRVEYRCADGTPFPVTFASEEDAALPWALDRLHGRDPASPLAQALAQLGRPGCERAYAEAGLPVPTTFRSGPRTNGFPYFCSAPIPDDEMAALFEGCATLVQRHGSAEGIWRELCLPPVRQVCGELQASGTAVSLHRLAEDQSYALHLTMIPAFVSGNDLQLLARVCEGIFAGRGEAVAYELTQGYPSDTLRADQALWSLGRHVARSAALGAALASSEPAAAMAGIRESGEEPVFFAALDTFLDEFGWRGESWEVDLPNWRELGDGLWAQLGQMARPEVAAPDAALAAAAGRRVALVEEIDALLAGDAEQRARFHRRVGRVASYVAVREERAHWQLVASGSLRHALLARGAALVERAVLSRPDDVLYLVPEEVETAAGDLASVVSGRRAEHDHLKTLEPPPVVGRAPDESHATSIGIDGGPSIGIDGGPSIGIDGGPSIGIVRGRPAARGVATGRARVVVDLSEAHRVEAGDVLVCVMTSPPWTPLFGIAAAVVGDYGERGSHPAIAAREYGIPCVLGTRVGTATIPDGALVTVDGDTGAVKVLSTA